MVLIKAAVEAAWGDRAALDSDAKGPVREAVDAALALLDRGVVRVAEPDGAGGWRINQWIKKAVLLSFSLNPNQLIQGPGDYAWFDKVPGKFDGWNASHFREAGFRAVPGAIVRHGAYIAPGAILMPSFVNIGAHVGEGTMVDTWATVGSCAQIGRNVHLSGGAGIGGVLEPLQADPVIIGDGAFIGARSEVAEGVRVGEGAVLSMGVYLGASTKIIDRETGEVFRGEVPPYAVVVPGSTGGDLGLYCAVIVKRVDERTRAKTSINDLLRD